MVHHREVIGWLRWFFAVPSGVDGYGGRVLHSPSARGSWAPYSLSQLHSRTALGTLATQGEQSLQAIYGGDRR